VWWHYNILSVISQNKWLKFKPFNDTQLETRYILKTVCNRDHNSLKTILTTKCCKHLDSPLTVLQHRTKTGLYMRFAVGVLALISCMACILHLTSSVGHKTSDEKKAAKNPDVAFWSGLSELISGVSTAAATAFWHSPYAINSTEFSATWKHAT